MISAPKVKACTRCAKSRRKCGKQRPQCLRCRTRGVNCDYPPARPSCFVPIREDLASNMILRASYVPDLPSPLELCFPLANDVLASWWFASPSTWTIDTAPPSLQSIPNRFTPCSLDRALRKVLEWLTQWVETGTCPFMHNQLYRDCFPAAIQTAYLSLSTYLHRNAMNESMIERIIHSRSTELVSEGLHNEAGPYTTLDNLMRVQALLVYQAIGLSSPSYQLRQQSELHIPVLENWLVILMQQSSILLSGPSSAIFTDQFILPQNHIWYAWILTESVRRIWLVIAGIQGLYKILHQSLSVTTFTSGCMGGTMFTSRKGFWEAKNAGEWEKQCGERYAGMVRLTETEKMFEMVPREEISEFARMVLECTYGVGWCEMQNI